MNMFNSATILSWTFFLKNRHPGFLTPSSQISNSPTLRRFRGWSLRCGRRDMWRNDHRPLQTLTASATKMDWKISMEVSWGGVKDRCKPTMVLFFFGTERRERNNFSQKNMRDLMIALVFFLCSLNSMPMSWWAMTRRNSWSPHGSKSCRFRWRSGPKNRGHGPRLLRDKNPWCFVPGLGKLEFNSTKCPCPRWWSRQGLNFRVVLNFWAYFVVSFTQHCPVVDFLFNLTPKVQNEALLLGSRTIKMVALRSFQLWLTEHPIFPQKFNEFVPQKRETKPGDFHRTYSLGFRE